jgi:DNA mismatch repair protein MutL
MNKIHLLSDELITRIAAGEVVERPASVIKELVENSLDAGADFISVAFEGAGRTKMVISDNGCGMSVGDAILALQRHATSKISRYEDLESIASFGFRGEALPSIAAVSRFKIITRSEKDDVAWEISVEGGKVVSKQPVAREVGTTIEVADLFFNTPARFKFLKSDQTERSQILRVMEEMIFASPHVTFEVQSENARPMVFQRGDATAPLEKN